MASVFSPPAGHAPPRLDVLVQEGVQAYEKQCAAFVEKLRQAARKAHPENDLIGEIINFSVGDGNAQYLVWSTKPLHLIHIATYDGYAIPQAHARGLRLADVREMVDRGRRLDALFAGKARGALAV